MEGGAWGCTFPPARVRLPNGYPGLGSLTRTAGLSPTVLSNESLACSQSYLHALPPDMSGRGWKTYMTEPAAIPNHSINPGNAR